MMWDVFNAITLAVLVYVVIPFWGAWFFHWLREKREIRKDRECINQLMADAEA